MQTKPSLMIMNYDPRTGFKLSKVPVNEDPIRVGEIIEIITTIAGPFTVTAIQVGADPRFRIMGPEGLQTADVDLQGTWRIDAIEIDDVPCPTAVAALEAETLRGHPNLRTVRGDFGRILRKARLRATNVGEAPAYFYSTWELDPRPEGN